jgi:3-dehydrosphinganine reductase
MTVTPRRVAPPLTTHTPKAWHTKHVIVTGGSVGIGAAVAKALAVRSARVSLIARGDSALRAAGDDIGADWASADVSRPAELADAVGALETRQGPCDVIVCCAGIVTPGMFADLTPNDIERQMAVNYFGSINSVRAVLPGMLNRSQGRIVLVSSTAGLIGVTGYTGYGPTKAAIRHYALSLRYELDRTGVAISVVYPPDTYTPGFAKEVQSRPPETAAIAGAIAPTSATRVADAIVSGIERGKSQIGVDLLTKFLLIWEGLPEAVARPILRRVIRRARTFPTDSAERQRFSTADSTATPWSSND